jgi:outer membrane protein TolC
MKTNFSSKRIRLFALCLSGLLSLGSLQFEAQAQDAPQQWRFSLEEAAAHALEHNTAMIKANLAVRQAEAAKWEAIASYLPQLNVNVNYNNYLGASLDLFGQTIPMDPSSTLTLQASQLIFNANAILGMQLSELSRQMSELGSNQSELAVKQNVKSSYYSILMSENNKLLLQKNVENMRSLAQATRAKVEVGIGEQTEADEIEIALANLENSLKQTERTIELAYNSLRLLLGLNADDQIDLSDGLQDVTDKQAMFALLASGFDPAENVDLMSGQLSLEMNKKQVQSAIAGYLPTISAVYQRNEILLKTGFDPTTKNALVLTASMPLFTSGKTTAGLKKAQLAYESAQEDLELMQNQLLIQDKQLRFNLKSALESYEIQERNIVVSKRMFDNVTKKFEQGLSSSLEVTNASNNLLTAQSNFIQSAMSLLNARDALEKLLGIL